MRNYTLKVLASKRWEDDLLTSIVSYRATMGVAEKKDNDYYDLDNDNDF